MSELPQLVGSEKQVRWAKNIRREKNEEWRQGVGDNPLHGELLERILKNDSAAWWISYRDCDLKNVLNQTEYGVDRVKQELEEYRKGQKSNGKKRSSPASAATAAKPPAALIRSGSDEKFMMIGPTRDRFTGEVVQSDDAPF